MALFSRTFFNTLCITALLCSYQAMASDDEYLRMLEGEAEDVKLDQSGQLKDKEKVNSTFVFYRKLNSVDQQTVYYHYSKASPAALDPIRQDILNHLKK